MISKKRIQSIAIISLIVVAGLAVSAWFFISYEVSRLDANKETITQTVSEKLNRDVACATSRVSLTFRTGLSLQFTNVVVKEKNQTSDFLNIQKLFLRVSLLPLLRNRVVLKEIILEEPHLILKRDREGVLNIADLLKEDKERTLEVKKVTVEKGLIKFIDLAVGENEHVTSLENIYCKIDDPFWGNRHRFKIKTLVGEEKNKAELLLNGTYRSAPAGQPVYESHVKASVILKGTDVRHYGAYLKKYAPIELTAGRLDIQTTVSGKFSDFSSKGSITLKNLRLAYPGVFRGSVEPRVAKVDYTLARKDGDLDLNVTRLTMDRVEARGRFAMHDMGKQDPSLQANAVISNLSMKENRPAIPWGIIPSHVGDFIDAHIKEGNLQVVEGSLNGRLSQICHMNDKGNEGVLYVKGDVNNGVFLIEEGVPTFHDISGKLELKNRQFLLHDIRGKFGATPSVLNGGISDFAVKPVVYSAEVSAQPDRDDIVWFMGTDKFGDFKFSGPSQLMLSGKGPSDHFQINAAWDLTDAAYELPDRMTKPAKRKNQLNARIVLNKEAADVPSFNYTLFPLNVSGKATHRFSGKTPVSFNIKSGNFDVREVVPLLPSLKKFVDLTGSCLVDVNGNGDARDSDNIQLRGSASLNNISFKTVIFGGQVKGLTGKASFNGRKMTTSWLKAKVGESNVLGRFRIYDLRKPEWVSQFNSDGLRTADLGLQSRKGDIILKDVKGQVAFEDDFIRLDNISFKLGKSVFNLLGNVREFANPQITLTVTSPFIDSDDFEKLIGLEIPRKEGETQKNMMLKATLAVESGALSEFNFRKLNGSIKYTPGVLYVETMDAGILEGKVRVKGKVDILPAGNHYEGNIAAEKVSLEKLQGYFKMGESEITGYLSLTGDLSVTGRNTEELKRTATGTFKVNAEKGVLKKFAVISKIFSLLNVLQLAKLHLPDMAQNGMPYEEISAHASLKNGIISSEDFFIHSGAMEISGVGKVDIIRKRLDSIVGVHPLQTIDWLVSRIPVAGWLVTDKRGKLITVSFKINGPWDDPEVSAIPIQSIGEGTLDIFRRLFQLPEKMVTDTGEVILGH